MDFESLKMVYIKPGSLALENNPGMLSSKSLISLQLKKVSHIQYILDGLGVNK